MRSVALPLGRPLALFALLALLVGLGGCSRAQSTHPNVVLISIDTLRPDRLGCYGATTVETPAIDALAREGVRFENAFTPVPLTLPAHWTVHTGVEPWHHGVVDNGMAITPRAAPVTLAERFSAAGYDTAAFVAAFVLHRTFGLDRGFARYDDGPEEDAALDRLVHATAPADERVGRALTWLSRRKGEARPFFLWLHLYDPHAPYQPPSEFRARYGERPYDGEVAFVDTQIARLLAGLDRMGLDENTLVVLTSDHGESLGEHGEETHGVLLYDATLRIPLIVRAPGATRAATVRRDLVTLADVAPTVLTIAKLSPTPHLDGRDLFAQGEARPRRLGAISESPRRRLGWASLVAQRDTDWKYIQAPRPELFDLRKDPREITNRIATESPRATDLARGAHGIERELSQRLAARVADQPSAEERARLAALGYIGSSAPNLETSRPDPKDVIASMGALDRAYQRFSEGHLDSAQTSFQSLLDHAEFPPAAALEGLARIARMKGRTLEAEAAYRGLLEIDPENVAALAQLVLLALERRDPTAAVRWAEKLTKLAPRDGGASRLLAEALLADGDAAAAQTEWQRGLAAAPRAGWLRLGYARFLNSAKRSVEAQRELDLLLANEEISDELRNAALEERARQSARDQ